MAGVSHKTPLPHWQRLMDKAGWTTATQMARAAGLSIGTAHFVVYGDVIPKNDTILKIAKAACIPPEDIAADIYRYLLDNKLLHGGITR